MSMHEKEVDMNVVECSGVGLRFINGIEILLRMTVGDCKYSIKDLLV